MASAAPPSLSGARASGLKLAVVREDRCDLAPAGQCDRRVEMDRFERPDPDRVQPRRSFEHGAIDVDEAYPLEQALGGFLEAYSPSETAQLHDEQRARPPGLVSSQGVANQLRVGLTEKDAAQRRGVDVRAGHQ